MTGNIIFDSMRKVTSWGLTNRVNTLKKNSANKAPHLNRVPETTQAGHPMRVPTPHTPSSRGEEPPHPHEITRRANPYNIASKPTAKASSAGATAPPRNIRYASCKRG